MIMETLKNISISVRNKPFIIKTFNIQHTDLPLRNASVNILASGPSIVDVHFNNSFLATPSIFVNGSLSLVDQYNFSHVVAYVISDERFVGHNSDVLDTFYCGQPLYITVSVLQAIVDKLPHLIEQYHHKIQLIFAANRPLTVNEVKSPFQTLISKLTRKPFVKRLTPKLPLSHFESQDNFVLDLTHHPEPIGVSLDISDGFVEAGTVAYVAAQLAYTLGASTINLYGIDLLNANQPRFYEDKDNKAPCKLEKAVYERIVPSFNLLGEVYNKYDVKVINHSPISNHLFIQI